MKRLRATANLLKYRALLLVAFCWRRLLFRTRFIAITGSVGKTTTKDLLAAILNDMPARTLATRRSSNGAKHIAQAILRARPWDRFVVLEAGTDQPGWIRRSAWLIGPDIAIILSVARTHTNNFQTLEDTAREKAALLAGVRRRGVAILNADDRRVAAMAASCKARVLRFGTSANADVRASEISSQWPDRFSLSVTAEGNTARVNTQLVGTHWSAAVLATVTAALECGMTLTQAAQLISRVPPTTGRMEPCMLPNGAVVLRDDFNGSLDTFIVAFEALKAAKAIRKILVITTVGDSPESWDHRTMRIAREAASVVQMLVLLGKAKDTKRAGKAALDAGLFPENLLRFEDLRELSAFLKSTLRQGDLMLLRGRTTDHITRVFHAQTKEVACWKSYCTKRNLCDHCSELFGENPQQNLSESRST